MKSLLIPAVFALILPAILSFHRPFHASTPAQSDDPAALQIVNELSEAICHAWISPSASGDWGADWLDEARPVSPGETRAFNVTAGEYDAALADCRGNIRYVAADLAVQGEYELHAAPAPTADAACGTLLQSGLTYRMRSQPAKAQVVLEGALACYQAETAQSGENAQGALDSFAGALLRLGQHSRAIEIYQEASDLAAKRGSQADQARASVGLAAAAYLAGDAALFRQAYGALPPDPNPDAQAPRHALLQQIARYLILERIDASGLGFQALAQGDVEVYAHLDEDVDADGVLESVISGGAAVDWGIGATLLFDWQSGMLRHVVLVDASEGYQTVLIQDVNQDGRLEILSLLRLGSTSTLFPYILAYDGQGARWLLDREQVDAMFGFAQGALQFKDLDADGMDEMLVWEAVFGDDESFWGDPHVYDIHVYRWDGRSYIQAERHTTAEKFHPSALIGTSVSLLGAVAGAERDLAVETSRAELRRLRQEAAVTDAFVQDLLARSQSAYREGLYLQGKEIADLAIDAANSLPGGDLKSYLLALALDQRGVHLGWAGQGRSLEARQDFDAAISLLEAMTAGPVVDKETIQRALAATCADAGLNASSFDLQSSLRFYDRAAQIARELGDSEALSIATANVGSAYFFLRDLEQAQRHYTQALSLDEQLERPFGRMMNRWGLGLVTLASGDTAAAAEALRQAASLSLEVGDYATVANLYRDLGYAYHLLGQNDDALANLESALRLSDPSEIRVSHGLIYVYLGDTFAALGDTDASQKHYRKVLDTFGAQSRYSPYGTIWRAHAGLAAMAVRQDQPAQAVEHLGAAIDIIEHERSRITIPTLSTLFQDDRDKSGVYAHMIALLHAAGRDAEAFHYSERARSRALLDQLANARIDPEAGAAPGLAAQRQALLDQIRSLEATLTGRSGRGSLRAEQRRAAQQRLEAAYAEHDHLLTQMALANPRYGTLNSVQASPLISVQQALPDGVTLLEYFVAPTQTLAFVVNRDSFHARLIAVTSAELSRQVEWFRQFPSLDGVPQPARELYRLLVAPLRQHLHTPALLIVAHQELHYLPFAALHDGARYLVEDFVIGYSPSASVLRQAAVASTHRRAGEGAMLVFGNPANPNVTPLKGAQAEAEAVAALFGVPAYTGTNATESRLWEQAPAATAIHLAAHGEFRGAAPQFSRLYLAPGARSPDMPGDRQDGALETREVWNLPLNNVELVTLSACQTQLGRLSAGDELVGLSRAFLYAGARSLVASLWSVDDESTATLMTAFYRNLRNGMGQGEALKQATIDTMKQHPSPYYWSAFTLVGELGPLKGEQQARGQEAGPGASLRAGVAAVVVVVLALAGTAAGVWLRRRRK